MRKYLFVSAMVLLSACGSKDSDNIGQTEGRQSFAEFGVTVPADANQSKYSCENAKVYKSPDAAIHTDKTTDTGEYFYWSTTDGKNYSFEKNAGAGIVSYSVSTKSKEGDYIRKVSENQEWLLLGGKWVADPKRQSVRVYRMDGMVQKTSFYSVNGEERTYKWETETLKNDGKTYEYIQRHLDPSYFSSEGKEVLSYTVHCVDTEI